jgi:hypothetical protein
VKPNRAKLEIFAKYFSDALCKKLKSLQKFLKNAEKSCDPGHIRMVMSNNANLKIFAKYFWEASEKVEIWQKS